MIKNSDTKISSVHTGSPSITQETKGRFNELLNAALSRDTSDGTVSFKTSIPQTNTTSKNVSITQLPYIIPLYRH